MRNKLDNYGVCHEFAISDIKEVYEELKCL